MPGQRGGDKMRGKPEGMYVMMWPPDPIEHTQEAAPDSYEWEEVD